jgi:23S rRNA pseudouridine1911/1915/1917 synthase
MKARSDTSIRLNANWPAVEILFEDESILALDKPAGLLVSPDRWDKRRDNLMGLLHNAVARQAPWTRTRNLDYIANAHRLDCHTSGVLLLARHRPILVRLAEIFKERLAHKTYFALVRGAPPEDPMSIDLPLGPHPSIPGLTAVDRSRKGKPSVTSLRVEERFSRYTLLRVEPTTGRLHQVRVHLQAIGCPLVADDRYGDGRPLLLSWLKPDYKMKAEGERPLLARPALHAAELSLPHPVSGVSITITAPWPKDLLIALKYLRKFGAV